MGATGSLVGGSSLESGWPQGLDATVADILVSGFPLPHFPRSLFRKVPFLAEATCRVWWYSSNFWRGGSPSQICPPRMMRWELLWRDACQGGCVGWGDQGNALMGQLGTSRVDGVSNTMLVRVSPVRQKGARKIAPASASVPRESSYRFLPLQHLPQN